MPKTKLNWSQFEEGVKVAIGRSITPAELIAFQTYTWAVLKWNKVHNLVGPVDEAGFLATHLLDSLSAYPYLVQEEGPVIDVGTGAGLPGIPLAVMLPDREFCLVEPTGKKVAFMRQAIHALGLKNVLVHEARIEQVKAPVGGIVISRAFTSITSLANLVRHLQPRFIIAMKSAKAQEELEVFPSDQYRIEVHPVTVPFLDAKRYILVLESL